MVIDKNFHKKIGIYCIKNLTNDKCYVGSSINIHGRLLKHRAFLRGGYHQNPHLQNAWNKYKEDYFICFVLEECEINELTDREQCWISKIGHYNIIKDVIRLTMSDESKTRMSNTRKFKMAQGIIPKTNTKKIKKYLKDGEFIREYNSITEAANDNNISCCQIRRVTRKIHKTAGGFQWKYSNDESEVEAYSGRDYTTQKLKMKKSVLVLDTQTGIFHEFSSYKDCGNFFNKSFQTISRAMKNKRNLYKNRYVIQDLKKQEELLENPITVSEDNQQPSLSSNTFEGSTTNSQSQTDNAEAGNGNKSILPNY